MCQCDPYTYVKLSLVNQKWSFDILLNDKSRRSYCRLMVVSHRCMQGRRYCFILNLGLWHYCLGYISTRYNFLNSKLGRLRLGVFFNRGHGLSVLASSICKVLIVAILILILRFRRRVDHLSFALRCWVVDFTLFRCRNRRCLLFCYWFLSDRHCLAAIFLRSLIWLLRFTLHCTDEFW